MSDRIKIGIVDTKTSNIQSVINACKNNNLQIDVIDKEVNINTLNGLIVPGVGSFNAVMNNLREKNIDKTIFKFIDSGKPLLFICIGMQILFENSEENEGTKGLSIIKGKVKKIPNNFNQNNIKVPVIGWNKLNLKMESRLIKNTDDFNSHYYFIHSYYADVVEKNCILSTTSINDFEYCSAINFKNIYATQFHPEKSGKKGLEIYSNFKKICLDV